MRKLSENTLGQEALAKHGSLSRSSEAELLRIVNSGFPSFAVAADEAGYSHDDSTWKQEEKGQDDDDHRDADDEEEKENMLTSVQGFRPRGPRQEPPP